jgi:23S rRNA (uracil1939-C5)-methyltransferase
MTERVARVEIASVAAGGDGVGRTEGMVVFVPRTAPGDVALVRLAAGKRFARGHLESIEIASPLRVEPACPHYVMDRCGGCQLQHLAYEAQLSAKGTIIGDALRRIGKRPVDPPVVEPSDAQWRYRRKLTLHLRRVGTAWVAGLHPYDDPVAVFDLRDCPITSGGVLAVWAELRPLFSLLPDENALRVAVRLTEQGASVVVEGGGAWPTADRFFEQSPSVSELWWRPEVGRLRRLAVREGGARAGASFVQVNARVAAALRRHVLERVRSHDPSRVLDAYAGMGDTAIPLAADGRTVVAIELDRDAVASFRDRLRTPSEAIAGRVEDHLPAALPADVVLLNPPRAGVDARVTAALESAARAPRAVIYVSCDPATLARDVARMPRYRVASLRAYDMFPQTAHVETVCELVPEAA